MGGIWNIQLQVLLDISGNFYHHCALHQQAAAAWATAVLQVFTLDIRHSNSYRVVGVLIVQLQILETAKNLHDMFMLLSTPRQLAQ